MNIIYPKAEEEKSRYHERYELAAERVRGIKWETNGGGCVVPEQMRDYFAKVSSYLVQMMDTYEAVDTGSFYELSLEELQQRNRELYQDILPENYDTSYANPAYAAEKLGNEFGRYLCALYGELREILVYVFEKRLFFLVTGLELFIEIYDLMEDENCEPHEVRNAIYYYVSDYADMTIADRIEMMLDPEHCFARSLIETADLDDLRYLYYFGEYIGDNEIGTACHLGEMEEARIEEMASTYTEGYRNGFALYRIDLSCKKTVNIRYRLGFERMIRAAVRQFRRMGLETTMYRAVGNLIYRNGRGIKVGYSSGGANPQYDYDHRFDEALIFGKALADRKLAQQRCAYEEYREQAAAFAGPAVIEVFGEDPFVPVAKKESAAYTEKQRKQKLEYQSAASLLSNEFIPGDQVSFTIIAYPVPEIGRDYGEIFDETVRVNTLDSTQYGVIQQKLIDALDQGEYVTVTGRGDNRTSLTVALHPLEDPEHQTDFENCLADVNIPLGEVFTSPKLEGTHGTLHVTEVYLNELKYENLTLEIKDGTVTDYICTNFGTEQENKAYIEENLLFQHPTLPMGEFAIGTNTTAYAMGQKYGISHLLPILIAEKTGPHFAFGDTCFSHEEELVTYNPDGKQMMAKENRFSEMRHTEPSKAYFNCHTDVTIPYHELGDIIVHCRDGREIVLIQKGRFVLEGTEELNRVL
ncbi:aminopeptidase [Jutongia huaianensis]|uniref:Aminopeptidase n=1 Tax=Jutongia huaianensis TaxID=2763668 RepID=A0ABR7N1F7_9FIRM|nr:aminopeptidase [Jutongia huaianensis]MBC8562461.1 aminopeptidase [Jutongia huaianensis]